VVNAVEMSVEPMRMVLVTQKTAPGLENFWVVTLNNFLFAYRYFKRLKMFEISPLFGSSRGLLMKITGDFSVLVDEAELFLDSKCFLCHILV